MSYTPSPDRFAETFELGLVQQGIRDLAFTGHPVVTREAQFEFPDFRSVYLTSVTPVEGADSPGSDLVIVQARGKGGEVLLETTLQTKPPVATYVVPTASSDQPDTFYEGIRVLRMFPQEHGVPAEAMNLLADWAQSDDTLYSEIPEVTHGLQEFVASAAHTATLSTTSEPFITPWQIAIADYSERDRCPNIETGAVLTIQALGRLAFTEVTIEGNVGDPVVRVTHRVTAEPDGIDQTRGYLTVSEAYRALAILESAMARYRQ